jgi:hypothetical protein
VVPHNPVHIPCLANRASPFRIIQRKYCRVQACSFGCISSHISCLLTACNPDSERQYFLWKSCGVGNWLELAKSSTCRLLQGNLSESLPQREMQITAPLRKEIEKATCEKSLLFRLDAGHCSGQYRFGTFFPYVLIKD